MWYNVSVNALKTSKRRIKMGETAAIVIGAVCIAASLAAIVFALVRKQRSGDEK